MKLKFIILLLIGVLLTSQFSYSQNVGIGTNTPKDLSKLDVESTTTGFLLPRMTTAQRNTLGSNVSALGASLSAQYNGLMVYDISNNTLYMWDSNKSDFTNGGWNNVLDADASVNDADADPNNELQTLSQTGTSVTLSNGGGTISVADNDSSATNEIQDLSISGNTLSLSGDPTNVDLTPYVNTDDQKIDVFNLSGTTLNLSLESDVEATKTVDLSSLQDKNWYEVGQTRGADDITDNIYTQGNVGIGETNPTYDLTITNTKNALSGTNVDVSELSVKVGSANETAGNASGIGFGRSSVTGNIGAAIIHERTGSQSNGKLHFATKNTSVSAGDIPIRMTINEAGDVGIGTTTPTDKLDVVGNVVADNIWMKVAEVDLSAVNSYTITGLNGDVQKSYKIEFQGSLTASGTDRKILLQPNGITSGYNGFAEYRGDAGAADWETNGFYVGRNGWGENADFSFSYTMSAITGRRRTGYGQSTFYHPTSGRFLGYSVMHSAWNNTTTNITSLRIYAEAGGTITGKLVVFALR